MTANDFWVTLTSTLHRHSQGLFESDKLLQWICQGRTRMNGIRAADRADVRPHQGDNTTSCLHWDIVIRTNIYSVLRFILFVRSALLSSIATTLSGCQNCHMFRRRLVPASATCHRGPQWKVISAESSQQVSMLGDWLLKITWQQNGKKKKKSSIKLHRGDMTSECLRLNHRCTFHVHECSKLCGSVNFVLNILQIDDPEMKDDVF